MSTSRKKIFAALLISFIALYTVINLPTTQRKVLYPFPYRDEVEKFSSRYKMDKFLVLSVMKVESNFSENARSRSGAVGLMQIMPETANWIARQLDEEPPTINQLHETDKNIKYGVWYLSELEYEFFENDILALAAYNAGRGNVHHWMDTNGWTKDFSDVDSIPYLETRNYVKRVLKCREKYGELYENSSTVAKKLVHPHELKTLTLSLLQEK